MVGCRLNQSEIETFARQFRKAGHQIVPSAAQADMVVVNTCTVTHLAASDSRQKIRQAARAGVEKIVVTGCWSTLNENAATALEGVTRVVSNTDKDNLVTAVLEENSGGFDREPLAREPLPGIHLRTRAFIKAQDGCDYHCTFCITRLARGKARSRMAPEVIADIQAALQGGAQEVVLTGVALGSWGYDSNPPANLTCLIQAILNETSVPRLRLSSVEPWDLDGPFFELWQDPRMCRHLHLPLQSGCAATLRRMARQTTPQAYADLAGLARSAAPDLALTTDIIVGFPGETDEEFQESLDYVKSMAFASGHVFTYSARPGTAAVHLPGQVPPAVSKSRSAAMRLALAESARHYQANYLGDTMTVLWEATDRFNSDGWRLSGLTGNYLRVFAHSKTHLWNQLSRVRLNTLVPDGIEGEILGG